ncbi:hypothetical protein F4781DRAFT_56255 [Annulohypoxylon bovei var. microspora]|nr:hypothetical protein F4781DRAFT_56255 [Annulohypoxylon bovei var. microspora]
MSNTSRNNSSTSLMGFSVHQPAIGSPLQFFPAMGSKQLDEMINAYVPGDAPITNKRATVSMEFFEHSMATGELFKFFMVYPSLGSATESPSGSMLDSGYGSNFTSPVMSESQWTQGSSTLLPSSESKATKRAALSNDFSHLPGMKIITKDGQDVTNMTSRGCKTKEQRDHAHLMRIIKACDSCRRKKVRCDPSHKRSAGSSSTAKISKKAKKTAASTILSPAPPPQPTLEPLEDFLQNPSFSISDEAPSLSFDSTMTESSVDLTMDWNQFIQFDEEPTESIPFDYDFFHDPQGLLSPTSYNSFSPSQPITPAQTLGVENMMAGTAEGEVQVPLPPYLNPGGEAGNNYADFNLYSPGSSTGLEDDPSLSKEVAAMPLPDYFEYSNHQRPVDSRDREISTGEDRNFDTQLAVSPNVQHRTSLFGPVQALSPISLDTWPYYESLSHTAHDNSGRIEQVPEWHVPVSPGGLSPLPPARLDELHPQPRIVSSPTEADIPRARVNTSSTQLNATSSRQQELQPILSSSSADFGITKLAMTNQQSQQRSVAMLTSGTGAWSGTFGHSVALALVTTEPSSGGQSSQKHNWQAQSKHIPNETLAPRSPVLESCRTDGKPQSPVSLSQPTQPMQFVRNAAGKKMTSTPVVELGIDDNHKGNYYANSSTADLAAQDTTIPSANTQSALPDGSVPYSSHEGANNGVLLSGVLDSALAVMALHALSFLLAITTVYQWRFFSNSVERFETTPILAGSLSVVSASIKPRQRTIENVDMLDLSTHPLSFLRRLPFTVMNSIKSRYSQLSGAFSRIHCNFEKKYNFREAQGMRRLPRMTSLV